MSSADALRLHDQAGSRHRVDQGPPRRSRAERTLSSCRFGPCTLQAASAAAPNAAATGWAQIVGTYGVVARAELSPAVELKRAVAVAMRDGPVAGSEAKPFLLAEIWLRVRISRLNIAVDPLAAR